MSGTCVDVTWIKAVCQPRPAPSLTSLPQHPDVNTEMTGNTAPLKTPTTGQPQAGFPLISPTNHLQPAHPRSQSPSPWALGISLSLGTSQLERVGGLKGPQGEGEPRPEAGRSAQPARTWYHTED